MTLKSPKSSDYNPKLGVEGDSDLGFPALYGEARSCVHGKAKSSDH